MSKSSTIRVFVTWSEQTVFAGEDIECQITFRNIASLTDGSHAGLDGNNVNQERHRKLPPGKGSLGHKGPNVYRTSSFGKGHRPSSSFSFPAGDGGFEQGHEPWRNQDVPLGGDPRRNHKRSVSILSIGHAEDIPSDNKSPNGSTIESRRPRGHGRAASLQMIPRRLGPNGAGPPSAPLTSRSTTNPSPLSNDVFNRDTSNLVSPIPRNPNEHRASIAGLLDTSSNASERASPTSMQDFKFPSTSATPSDFVKPPPVSKSSGLNRTLSARRERQISRPKGDSPVSSDRSTPATRVLSPTMNDGGTPRSSGDFYSLSNNSTETLASEYLPQQLGRTSLISPQTRGLSTLSEVSQLRQPEMLMMGYAQAVGSFTLDGSLVDQSVFEEVKRKGVAGGQGGGVIGVESKRDNGMLGSFGWKNIGNSLSGFLNPGELSSIKEMRGTASSRSIPLLLTPQSILFVDLRLAPGESRTYNYCFKLPTGLPPSHRGKVIKTTYNLVIGTQRSGGAKGQQVKSVEIPFRVLSGVNSHGELLGHDLMQPYIILRDQARVRSISSVTASGPDQHLRTSKGKAPPNSESSVDDFMSYVDDLLEKPRENSSLGLLSPTESRGQRRKSVVEETSVKQTIDMAILRSNLATDQRQSANRFEITRSGQRVAVVMLARPAYRLGEIVTVAIDFTDSQIPCYAMHTTLETCEKVEPSIALRSDASIHRVTRKIYSTQSESALFARRLVFSPTIPLQATPSFITSGISFEWKLVIEFVTPRTSTTEGEIRGIPPELLEEISRDERGIVLAAAEKLECESFEISVPLRVYGAFGGSTDQEGSTIGLSV